MIEKYYFTFGNHGESYRLRPNPDVADGFNGGAYLGWKNPDELDTEYTKREFCISPECLEDVAEMFALAAEEVKDV